MREVLIDTHIFLWSQFEPGKLSANLHLLQTSTQVRWHLSQVSVWEIQIKYDLGKLRLPQPPGKLFPELIANSGFAYENIQDEAIFMLGKLPAIHKDPFDRLLIATALVNGWEIVTEDSVFENYPVRVVS